MILSKTVSVVGLSVVLFAASCLAQSEIISIHGSGTTNPSKCYWHVMDKLEARAKLDLRLTYRAIGSSAGQAEFLNNPAISDFGSGDIPISNDKYVDFTQTQGVPIMQLPVFVGAVSFFHSLPSAPNLNMTACTLAKVFDRQITTWDDKEILDINPNLKIPRSGFPINVAHRVDGSSSTSGITNYLASACDSVWDKSNTGSKVDWPKGTSECQGSGGMVKCINEQAGTIGYLDSGHGHLAGFEEVNLENSFGTLLTTTSAAARGGIAAAADIEGLLPQSADDDFSSVSLINQPGQFTWPIVAMTYVYVRKDLTFIANPQAQSLFVAFLKSLYDVSYVQQCIDDYEFALVDGGAKAIAMAAIDSLVLDANATPFVFEEETDLKVGQGEYVISAKRQTAAEVESDRLAVENADLKARVDKLETMLEQTMFALATMETEVTDVDLSQQMAEFEKQVSETPELTAALAMSSVSMILWVLFLLYVLFTMCNGNRGTLDESPPTTNGDMTNGEVHHA